MSLSCISADDVFNDSTVPSHSTYCKGTATAKPITEGRRFLFFGEPATHGQPGKACTEKKGTGRHTVCCSDHHGL